MTDFTKPSECRVIVAKEDQSKTPLEVGTITRRPVGPKDVAIDIKFSGVCHSDIHQARGDWGSKIFPMVTGHEIIGIVAAVGADVTEFKPGDRAGVGVMVDSCSECRNCKRDEENYCKNGFVGTYAGKFKYDHVSEKDAVSYGGYAKTIVCLENFVLHIPDGMDMAASAPLLCAGITTYSPLIQYGLRPSHKYAVVGLGGLGHMAVKFGVAFGAETTVISRGTAKKEEALSKLKAHHHLDSTDADAMKAANGTFDLILSTLSANHNIGDYLKLLDTHGKLVLVGLPEQPLSVSPFDLVGGAKTFAGSCIGGVKETQEMLNFCGRNNIQCEVEVIKADEINEAWERVAAGKVHYRCVIDIASL